MRTVILHYHLFKNAGTSVDAALKSAFPGRWVTREFSGGAAVIRRDVKQWIKAEPEAICFSSHTAILPPPEIEGVRVIPVIFVRNPIDRIVSAYNFERRQQDDTFGSVLARNTTLSGYIETRLALKSDRQCRNFHTSRLAQMYPESEGSELERALRAVEELPFVGVVEEFGKSINRLSKILIELTLTHDMLPLYRANVTRFKVGEKLSSEMAAGLSADLFPTVLQSNRDDLIVYECCKSRVFRESRI